RLGARASARARCEPALRPCTPTRPAAARATRRSTSSSASSLPPSTRSSRLEARAHAWFEPRSGLRRAIGLAADLHGAGHERRIVLRGRVEVGLGATQLGGLGPGLLGLAIGRPNLSILLELVGPAGVADVDDDRSP